MFAQLYDSNKITLVMYLKQMKLESLCYIFILFKKKEIPQRTHTIIIDFEHQGPELSTALQLPLFYLLSPEAGEPNV